MNQDKKMNSLLAVAASDGSLHSRVVRYITRHVKLFMLLNLSYLFSIDIVNIVGCDSQILMLQEKM